MDNEGMIGLLSFLSFGFSVIAAVLAIDTYALLRTGQSGGTWRVLIIASVIFALMQALRLAELVNFSALGSLHLSEIVELVFVIALTYAFYLQRRIFQGKSPRSSTPERAQPAREEIIERDTPDAQIPDYQDDIEDEIQDDDDAQDELESSHEWARLNGLPSAESNRARDDDGLSNEERRANERRTLERRNDDRRLGERRNPL